MNKFDTNELLNCFKMIVDLKGIKKLEEYITNLEQENNQLKKQYCERTDCSGRLGNSRKVERLIQENEELHNKIDKAIEYIKEHKRKDEFLNLNEWQTRDLLDILDKLVYKSERTLDRMEEGYYDKKRTD